MKHAIRALGWATTILWILVILFSGTVVYSAMQIRMNPIEEESDVTALDGVQIKSIPFSISNGGLYDITELNITTLTVAENETVISRSTTLVSLVPRGDTVNGTYDIVVSLDDMLARDLTYMLFNDTDLNVDMFVGLTYAHAIPLRISSGLDEALHWGAPLSNLTIGEISFIPPYNVPLSFENHAFFGLNGTVHLEIMDGLNNEIGSGTTPILVPAEDSYDDVIPVTVTGDFDKRAEVHLYFDTSVFSFGPVVIPIE